MSAFINPHSNEDMASIDSRRAAAWELADQMRAVISRMIENDAPESVIRDLTQQVAAIADTLDQYGHGRRYANHDRPDDGGPPSNHSDMSPMLGIANPIAAPMQFSMENDVVVATATYGNAYEGPPGHIHGGIVAAAMDELLGATQITSGQAGLTGTLQVVYRKPTPLHVPLRLEGRLDRVEGRKIFTSGKVLAADPDDPSGELQLRAEGTAVFIAVDFQKLAEAEHQRRQG